MATANIKFQMPSEVEDKLNAIARIYGHPDVKAWTLTWWRQELIRRATDDAKNLNDEALVKARNKAKQNAESINAG